jgi:hypothetical protein
MVAGHDPLQVQMATVVPAVKDARAEHTKT